MPKYTNASTAMAMALVSAIGFFHSIDVASAFQLQTQKYGMTNPSSPLAVAKSERMPRATITTLCVEQGVQTATMSSLPTLYPQFADILTTSGYTTPTPIQQTSAPRAIDGEHLLLIAATGSGKTLAYLLPALSRALRDAQEQQRRKTVLIIAPTRELAAQLARDASLLLPEEADGHDGEMIQNVLLACRGIPPPTPSQLADATVLIGTATEMYAVLTRISGAQNFIAGDTLSGVILDEVDVLLPPTPKTLRTSFDTKGNDAKRERKSMEQRRKLRAAQRRGVDFKGASNIKGKSIDLSNAMDSQVLTPTEQVLKLVASARFVGEANSNNDDGNSVQVLAGSATASRTTLDRLNKVLRWAGMEGGVVGREQMEGAWKGSVKVCRPEAFNDGANAAASSDTDQDTDGESAQHTIRAVTVPSVVDHRYVSMTKDTITNPQEILANVARVAKKLQPETSLLFICGEFSRAISKEKKKEAPKTSGKTAQARRDAKRRNVFVEKAKEKSLNGQSGGSGLPDPLSVRKACSILQKLGVDARPMHVVLGLEMGAEGEYLEEEEESSEDDNVVDLPPVLVTFEGSARGLHFDGVDVVFVVGRPTSAASYLHLAGRVGRAMSTREGGQGEVEIRPGTVVSFGSKGRVDELTKWTKSIGGTTIEEIEL